MGLPKQDRKRREIVVGCWSMIVCGTAISMLVSLVPAVGPIEREFYFLACSVALVTGGWLLGMRDRNVAVSPRRRWSRGKSNAQ